MPSVRLQTITGGQRPVPAMRLIVNGSPIAEEMYPINHLRDRAEQEARKLRLTFYIDEHGKQINIERTS